MPRLFLSSSLLRCLKVSWIFITIIVFWTVDANAQSENWLTLYPTEVDAIFRYDRIDQQNSGDSNQSSKEAELEVGIALSQQGHILAPEIAWFLLDIEPVYSKDEFESTTFAEDNSGDIFNYLFQLSLLRKTPGPLGFDLLAQRSSSLITGSLGSRYDNVIDSKTASVNWKTAVFPMSLSYTEESLEQEFRSSQNIEVSSRDEFSKSLRLIGKSSKMDLRLEHKTLDDLIITRNNDYQQNHANVNHRLPWGKGSELFTRLDFFDRNGFNANERQTFEEIARIQHTENIFSKTSYRYFSVTQNIETVENHARFELIHKLYKNLNTTASVDYESRSSTSLDEKIRSTDLDTQYHKQDLFGASVNAGLGVAYIETDRDSSIGLIDVVDESHVAPLSGAVTLNTRFILTNTIIVTNVDSTLVFAEGFDYEVNDLAGNLTEIQIISGGQINQGDTILVSYQASALPSQEFSTTQTRYNFGIDLGWVKFSHLDRKSDDKLMSGADESFLNDTRFTVTDLEFRWKINSNDIRVAVERQFTLAGGFESTSITYQQVLSWIYSRDIRLNLNITESFTEQVNRDSDLYSLDLLIDWRPSPGLSVRPTLGIWKRQDTEHQIIDGDRDDEFFTAGFRLHWKFRQINMNFSYYRNHRSIDTNPVTGGTQTDQDRVMFNLTRRFL